MFAGGVRGGGGVREVHSRRGIRGGVRGVVWGGAPECLLGPLRGGSTSVGGGDPLVDLGTSGVGGFRGSTCRLGGFTIRLIESVHLVIQRCARILKSTWGFQGPGDVGEGSTWRLGGSTLRFGGSTWRCLGSAWRFGLFAGRFGGSNL